MLEGVSAGHHEKGLEGSGPVTERSTDKKSAMKPVFATLIRVSERWNRVSISYLERQQLELLRRGSV